MKKLFIVLLLAAFPFFAQGDQIGGGGVYGTGPLNYLPLTGGAVSGSISSTKACASGYTRVTPNLCMASSTVSDTQITTTTCNVITSPSVDAKAIVLSVRAVARSSNTAAASDTASMAIWHDSACVSTYETIASTGYEFTAVLNQTLSDNRETFILRLSSPGASFGLSKVLTNGFTYYAIRGYYD